MLVPPQKGVRKALGYAAGVCFFAGGCLHLRRGCGIVGAYPLSFLCLFSNW